MQAVSTRHRRGGRGGIVRFGQDGPLLLGRPAAARAGDNDVRIGHRSRHRADTAPSDANSCIQSGPLPAQGGHHRALTSRAPSVQPRPRYDRLPVNSLYYQGTIPAPTRPRPCRSRCCRPSRSLACWPASPPHSRLAGSLATRLGDWTETRSADPQVCCAIYPYGARAYRTPRASPRHRRSASAASPARNAVRSGKRW